MLPSSPDNSLVSLARRCASGDQEAFRALHDRLHPGLVRVLLRRTHGQHDVADEIAQQTWVAVWDALCKGRYDADRSSISTFVYAISYKLWLQAARRAGRRPAIAPGEHEALSSDDADPRGALPLAELIEAARDCLQSSDSPLALTDRERGLITQIAAGVPERTIARELGVAASTVNAWKRAAFAKLRRCLAAKGFRGDIFERGSPHDE
ncbi:MAG: hypothetical protein CHACPFDD_01670 [Phycisphaerae bacterium]|nr:hypothetical protein [Phycisphaerae bacterium]